MAALRICANRRHAEVLFDHLVGAGEQRCLDGEAERPGGLEIDHQLVLGRRLHRQVGGLLALEDAVDVTGGTPKLVGEIRPIGEKAADGDVDSSVKLLYRSVRQHLSACAVATLVHLTAQSLE